MSADNVRELERIYLHGVVNAEEGRAWCDERISDDDTEYVRADLMQSALDGYAELARKLNEIRKDATAALATNMPTAWAKVLRKIEEQ